MRLLLLPLMVLLALPSIAGMKVWPDYLGVEIPKNMAPLNFKVEGGEGKIAAELRVDGRIGLVAEVGSDGAVFWPMSKWHKFLADHAGKQVEIVVCRETETLVATNRIARFDIDSHLTYRLISPSYSHFREMGIYQRNLSTFDERPLYRNLQCGYGQCVNCHTYNRSDPDEYLFHTRGKNAGTHVVSKKHGDAKRDLVRDWMIGFAQYPAWHPSGDFIAFSVNETKQSFYADHRDKVEVFDLRSDLVLYDLAADEMLPVETGNEIFETFPTWSPDGKSLFTARARTRFTDMNGTQEDRFARVLPHLSEVFYDLAVRTFDASTRRFSSPRILIDGKKSQQSVSLPKVSPDGRWVVFAVGPYGSFHVWHKDSDLWILDLKNMTIRKLDELNGDDSESYHCFTHDGRWMVFSTRRDDGTYTRPYFAAFDSSSGTFSKPFILPVEHPDEHLRRMRSYNVPEFSVGPVKKSSRQLRELIQR